jgi:hypothetical protein
MARLNAICPAPPASAACRGILDRIRVPFLVTHGENDRQISLDYARRTYDQLVNSPKRELKICDARTQGVEHVSVRMASRGFSCCAPTRRAQTSASCS